MVAKRGDFLERSVNGGVYGEFLGAAIRVGVFLSPSPKGGRKVKRLVMLVMTGALLVALAATVALARSEPLPPGPDEPGFDNEFIGTENSEVLFGTDAQDRIVGLGGHDYLNGLWGDDQLEAGQGDDLLVGEAGSDMLLGDEGNDYIVAAYGYWQQAPYAPAAPDFIQAGPGNDLVDSADAAGAPDDVRCGPGGDLVYAGVEDYVAADCEVVYRYFGF